MGTGADKEILDRRRFDESSRRPINAALPAGQEAVDGNQRSRDRTLLEHRIQSTLPARRPEDPRRRLRPPDQGVVQLIAEYGGWKGRGSRVIESGRRGLSDQAGKVHLRHCRIDDRKEHPGQERGDRNTARTKLGDERRTLILTKRPCSRYVLPSSASSPDIRCLESRECTFDIARASRRRVMQDPRSEFRCVSKCVDR